jgi:hypothetical protein
MERNRGLAALALLVAAGGTAFALANRAGPNPGRATPDPCVAVRELAATRSREADQAHAAYQAAQVPAGYPSRFAPDGDTAKAPVVYAVNRYAAVVEQNPACFAASVRADAAALARTWVP